MKKVGPNFIASFLSFIFHDWIFFLPPKYIHNHYVIIVTTFIILLLAFLDHNLSLSPQQS